MNAFAFVLFVLCEGGSFHDLEYISLGIAFLEWLYNFCSVLD